MAAPRHFGRYEVVQELGRGGMAVVYLAMDTQVNRLVAIKVLAQHLLADRSLATRFEREAAAIATLEHSAIVPLYDHGEEAGQRYLVFRYMEGGSLADRLARDTRLSVATVTQIAERIGSALTYAHGRGIVHRDVKPGNVLFDSNGEAWLCDFGIASLSEGASTLTAGASIGTPLYISPEQALGHPATAASDTYSLGVMLFEALTGYLPFTAEHPGGLLQQHAYSQPPDAVSLAPDLPVGVSNVLARALAKSPEARWETPLALARTLARVSQAATTTQPPGKPYPPVQVVPSPRPPAVRRPRPGPWLGGALAAVVIGAAIGGAVGVAQWSGENGSGGPSSTSIRPATQPSGAADRPLGAATVTASRTTPVSVAFTDPFDF